jgi:hypothetical protein
MNAFKCANCKNLIQVDSRRIGELVECPFCAHVQIVPEPMMPPGMVYCGYTIRSFAASGVLWNSYLAADPQAGHPANLVFLRVPNSFLLKRIKDFKAFAGPLCNAGTIQVEAFPALLDRRLVGDGLYFAYEAVRGAKSLAAVAEGAPLKPLDAVRLARKTAAALAAGWAKGHVVHLNLNPEKILVQISRLDVKIVDFGVAAAVAKEDRLLNDGLNIWDLRYAAPEFLADGRGDSPLCDIYSLGCVMAFMLTGRHPVLAEDEPADSTVAATIPTLAASKGGIPLAVVALVNSMTARNAVRRPQSWDEVVEALDDAVAALDVEQRAIENRKKVNLWGAYRSEPVAVLGHHGHSAGIASRKIYVAKPEDKVLVKAAGGRVFTADVIRPVNRQWPRSSAAASGERILMVAAAVVAVAFLAVVAGIKMNPSSRPQPPDTSRPDGVSAEAPRTADAGKTAPAVPAATERDAAPPSLTPPPTRKQAELLATFAQVEAYVLENPEDFDGAIQRYEAIKRPFVLVDNQPVIGEVNERIFAIERLKQRKIEAVMGEIVDAIAPFLRSNENDKAINYINTYQGPFSFDTKRQRKDLERKILDGISVAELERGKSILSVDAALEKHVRSIMDGDTAGFVAALERERNGAKNPALVPLIDSLIAQCRFYAENRQSLQANPAMARSLLKQLDAMNLPDGFMAKGLIEATAGNYEQAFAYFDRMPFGLGYHFFRPFGEREANGVLAKILRDNAIAVRLDSPDELIALLARKKIGNAAAQKLLAEVREYERNYADTEFLAANRRIIERLIKFSLDMLDDPAKAREKEIVISTEDGDSLGTRLAKVLEEADNWTTIRLRKGVYRLVSPSQAARPAYNQAQLDLEQQSINRTAFRLSLTGMKLIGEEGVIFENDLIITAQSVEISDIRIKHGKFNIAPNDVAILPDSGNIVVRNCVFEDEETRLIRASGITLDNCFMKGLFIERCNNVRLEHCTVIAQERGLSQSAALWINGDGVTIRDSIIYGEKYYALMFSDKGGSNKRNPSISGHDDDNSIRKSSEIRTNKAIIISGTVIYGEQGLCAFQFADRPIEAKDIIKNPSRVSRYFRSRGNIFHMPQFTDPGNSDWRLVKGTPGYKGGAPKYKGGPIYYSRARDARDCGVVWP